MCQQMEFPNFETRPNFKKAYDDGYDTGINWDGNYIPGGPFIFRNNEISRIEHDKWHMGFLNGLLKRLEENPHYRAWWDRNKGKQLYTKGVTIDAVRYKAPENTNV